MGTSCTKTGGTEVAPSRRDPIVAFTDLNLLHRERSTDEVDEEVLVQFPSMEVDSSFGGGQAANKGPGDEEKMEESDREEEDEVDPLGAAIRSPPVVSLPALSRMVSPDASRPTTPREKSQTLAPDPLIPFSPPLALNENPDARIRQWLDEHLAVRIKKSPLSVAEQEEAFRRRAKGNTVGRLAVSSVYGLSSSSGGLAAAAGSGNAGSMGPASRATTSLLQSQQGLSLKNSFQMAQLQKLNSIADEIVCELKQEDEAQDGQ
jgi:hypothetical protein